MFSSLLPLKQSVFLLSEVLLNSCFVMRRLSCYFMSNGYILPSLLSAEGRISSHTQEKKRKLESDRS